MYGVTIYMINLTLFDLYGSIKLGLLERLEIVGDNDERTNLSPARLPFP